MHSQRRNAKLSIDEFDADWRSPAEIFLILMQPLKFLYQIFTLCSPPAVLNGQVPLRAKKYSFPFFFTALSIHFLPHVYLSIPGE